MSKLNVLPIRKTCRISRMFLLTAALAAAPVPYSWAATNITKSSAANSGTISNASSVWTIAPDRVTGAAAFNDFAKFNLDAGDVANLKMNTASTLVNIIRDSSASQINGQVNAVNAANKIGGHLIFANANGIVVGAQGAIHAGSITLLTPTKDFLDSVTENNFTGALAGDEKNTKTIVERLQSADVPISASGVITVKGNLFALDTIKVKANTVTIDGAKILTGAPAITALGNITNLAGVNAGAGLVAGTDGSIEIVAEALEEGVLSVDGMGSFGGFEKTPLTAKVEVKGTTTISGSEVTIAANAKRVFEVEDANVVANAMRARTDASVDVGKDVTITAAKAAGAGVAVTATANSIIKVGIKEKPSTLAEYVEEIAQNKLGEVLGEVKELVGLNYLNLTEMLDKLFTLRVAYLMTDSKAVVNFGGKIQSASAVKIASEAISSTAYKSEEKASVGLGVFVTSITSKAETNVLGTARITAGNAKDITIGSLAKSESNIEASMGGESKPAKKEDKKEEGTGGGEEEEGKKDDEDKFMLFFNLAVGNIKTNASTNIASGAQVTADNGNISITAKGEEFVELDSSSNLMSEEAKPVIAIALGFSFADSNVATTIANGAIVTSGGGNINVDSTFTSYDSEDKAYKNRLSVGASIESEESKLGKVISFVSGIGSALGEKDKGLAAVKVTEKVGGLIKEKWTSAQEEKTEKNGGTKEDAKSSTDDFDFRLSGGALITEQTRKVTTTIAGKLDASTTGNVTVNASIFDMPNNQIKGTASSGENVEGTAFSIGGAVAYNAYDYNAKTLIASTADISGKDVTIASQVSVNADRSIENFISGIGKRLGDLKDGEFTDAADGISSLLNILAKPTSLVFSDAANTSKDGSKQSSATVGAAFNYQNFNYTSLTQVDGKINATGKLKLHATNKGDYIHITGMKSTSDNSSVNVGGAVFYGDYDHDARVLVGDSAQIQADSLDMKAENNLSEVVVTGGLTSTTAYVGVNGNVSLVWTDNVARATVSNKAKVTITKDAVIKALDDFWNVIVSGSIMKSDGVGVGAGITFNILNRDTTAGIVGDSAAGDGYFKARNLEISATNGGFISGDAIAAAIISKKDKEEEKPEEPTEPKEPKEEPKEDELDEKKSSEPGKLLSGIYKLLGLLTGTDFVPEKPDVDADVGKTANDNKSGDIPSKNDGKGGAGEGAGGDEDDTTKFGIAISGAVAINTGKSNATAVLRNGNITLSGAGSSGDALSIQAKDTTSLYAVTGGLAYSSGRDDTTAEVGVAGSFSYNQLGGDTKALLENSKVILNGNGNILVDAKNETDILAIGAGVAVATGGDDSKVSAAVAAVVMLNNISTGTVSLVKNLSLENSANKNLTVTATDSSELRAYALSLSAAKGSSGANVAVAADVSINRVFNLTEASIDGLTSTTALGALKAAAVNDAYIQSISGAITATTGDNGGSGINVGANFAYNQIGDAGDGFLSALFANSDAVHATRASIDNVHKTGGTTALEVGSLNVLADSTGEILGVAGVANIALGDDANVAVGAAWLQNSVGSITSATLGAGVKVKAAQDVAVKAVNSSEIIGVSATVGVAPNAKVGVSGSLAFNNIANNTQSTVLGAVDASGHAFTVSAKDTAFIASGTGGITVGGKVAVGFAISLNEIHNVTRASVSGAAANISGSSSANVLAESLTEVAAIALAVAAGKDSNVTFGGSFSANVTDSETIALVDGGAKIASTGNITVSGTDNATTNSLTGGIAAGGKVAVGVAISYNRIGGSAGAVVSGAGTSLATTGSGNITLKGGATDHDSSRLSYLNTTLGRGIHSAAIGGAFSNKVTVAGSVTVNKIARDILAVTNSGASLSTASGKISLQANDTASIASLAGSISASGKVAVGAALAYNTINGSVLASITGNGTSATTTTGAVALSAIADGDIRAIAIAGGGAGSVGVFISGAYNAIGTERVENLDPTEAEDWSFDGSANRIVRASIADNASVSSGGALALGASDMVSIYALVGAASGAGSVNIGGSVVYNHISGVTEAVVDGGKVTKATTFDAKALSDADIVALTVAAGGSGSVQVSGAVAINIIDNARNIYAGSRGAAGISGVTGATKVDAYDRSRVIAIALGAGGSGTANVGGSVPINYIGGNTSALLSGTFASTGSVTLNAAASNDSTKIKELRNNLADSVGTSIDAPSDLAKALNAITDDSDGSIFSIAVSGGGAGTASISGSVTLNKITRDITAGSVGTTVNIGSANDFSATAEDVAGVYSIAGALNGAGSVAIGASVAINKISGTVSAKNTASVTAKKLTLLADAKGVIWSGAIAGGGGGVVAANGSVTLNEISRNVIARISGGNSSLSGAVSLTARDSSAINSLAGSLGGGGVAAIGASVARNQINGNVLADITGASTQVTTASANAVSLSALANGDIRAIAIVGGGGGVASIGASVAINTVGTNEVEGIGGIAEGLSDEDETKSDTWNFTGTANRVVRASISNGATVSSGGALTLGASDATSIYALVGAVGGAGVANIGGSVVYNHISGATEAVVDGGKVTKATTFQATALSDADIVALTVAAGGAGVANITGAVAINIIDNSRGIYAGSRGSAGISGITGATTINAFDKSRIASLAVAGGGGGVANVGGAVSINYIGGNTSALLGGTFASTGTLTLNASATRDTAKIKALCEKLEKEEITDTCADLQKALTGIQDALEGITGSGNILGVSVSGGGAGVASLSGSVTINKITRNITAGSAGTVVNIGTGNDFNATAKDEAGIYTIAGAVNGAGVAAFGAGVAINKISGTVSAKNTATTTARNLNLTAEANDIIKSIAAAGGGAGLLAANGAVTLNKITQTVLASNSGGSATSVTLGAVSLTAKDTSLIESLAGQVTGAGLVALGASVATNDISGKVAAENSGSLKAASLTLKADANSTIKSIAAGGGGAGLVAANGSVSLNDITRSILAQITGGTSTITGAVSVTAKDTSIIKSLAGQVSGAGLAAFGASVATNSISTKTVAKISGTGVNLDAGGDVKVEAESAATISTIAVSGAAAGAVSANGIVMLNDLKGETTAEIVDDAKVKAGGNVFVHAKRTGTTELYAAGGSLSLLASFGGAVLVNDIYDKTTARIYNATVDALANGGTVKYDNLNNKNAYGVVVSAENDTVLAGKTGGIGFGLAVEADVNILFQNLETTTQALIQNATINKNSTGASNQSVIAFARDNVSVRDYVAQIDIGALSVSGISENVFIGKTVRASIDASLVSAQRSVLVQAESKDTVDVSMSSLAASLLGAAVNISNVDTASKVEASISGPTSSVSSTGTADVLANSVTNVKIGNDAKSFALIDASGGIGIVTIHGSTTADVAGTLDASGALNVKATSAETIVNDASTVAGGLVSGTVGVNFDTIRTTTAAEIRASANINQNVSAGSTQDVIVLAQNTAIITDDMSGIAGGLIEIGGTIGVETIKTVVTAGIASNAKVNAGRDISVTATGAKTLTSTAYSGGGGLLAFNGAVVIATLGGTSVATDGKLAKSTLDSIRDASQKGLSEWLKGKLTSSTTALTGSNYTAPNKTSATIGAGTVVNAGKFSSGSINVTATDTAKVTAKAGGDGGGIISAGAGYAKVDIANTTTASIAGTLSATGGISVKAISTDNNSTATVGGGNGGILDLNKSESKIYDKSVATAAILDNTVITKAASLTVSANQDLRISAKSNPGSYSLLSGGIMDALAQIGGSDDIQKASSSALIGSGVTIGSETQKVGAVDVEALGTYLSDAAIVTYGVKLMEIGASQANSATYYKAATNIGTNSSIYSSSRVRLNGYGRADSTSKLSTSKPFNVVDVGSLKANSTLSGDVLANIGSYAKIVAGSIDISARELYHDKGSLADLTQASEVSLVKAAKADANATANGGGAKVNIGSSANFTTSGDISISTETANKANASASATSVAAMADIVKFSAFASTNSVASEIVLGQSAILSAGRNLTVRTDNRTDTRSMAILGSDVALASKTEATSSARSQNLTSLIVVFQNAQLSADADLTLSAEHTATGLAKTYINRNFTLADLSGNAPTSFIHSATERVTIYENAKLTAQNITIHAKSNTIDILADSYTYAAGIGAAAKRATATIGATNNAVVEFYNGSTVSAAKKLNVFAGNNVVKIKTSAVSKAVGGAGSAYSTADATLNGTISINVNSGANLFGTNINIRTDSGTNAEANVFERYANAESQTVVNYVTEAVKVVVCSVLKYLLFGWAWGCKEKVEYVVKKVQELVGGAANETISGDGFCPTSNITIDGTVSTIEVQRKMQLIINADGTIDPRSNIAPEYNTPTDVFLPAISASSSTVSIVAKGAGSTLDGNGLVKYQQGLGLVEVENASTKNVCLQTIDIVGAAGTDPILNFSAEKMKQKDNQFQPFYNFLQSAEYKETSVPTIKVRNTGASGNIRLVSEALRNPAGIVSLDAGNGSITLDWGNGIYLGYDRNNKFRIEAMQVDLRAGGNIASSSEPLAVRAWDQRMMPSEHGDTKHARISVVAGGDVFLSVQAIREENVWGENAMHNLPASAGAMVEFTDVRVGGNLTLNTLKGGALAAEWQTDYYMDVYFRVGMFGTAVDSLVNVFQMNGNSNVTLDPKRQGEFDAYMKSPYNSGIGYVFSLQADVHLSGAFSGFASNTTSIFRVGSAPGVGGIFVLGNLTLSGNNQTIDMQGNMVAGMGIKSAKVTIGSNGVAQSICTPALPNMEIMRNLILNQGADFVELAAFRSDVGGNITLKDVVLTGTGGILGYSGAMDYSVENQSAKKVIFNDIYLSSTNSSTITINGKTYTKATTPDGTKNGTVTVGYYGNDTELCNLRVDSLGSIGVKGLLDADGIMRLATQRDIYGIGDTHLLHSGLTTQLTLSVGDAASYGIKGEAASDYLLRVLFDKREDISVTGSIGLYLTGTQDVSYTLGNLSARDGDADITLNGKFLKTATGARLTGRAVTLTAREGDIDVTTTAASLTATASKGSVRVNEFDAITLTNVSAGSGAITVTAGGSITATSVTASNGAIGITANGAIAATSVQSLTDNGSNGITLLAQNGNIAVGQVLAGASLNDLILNATGSITSLGTTLLQGDNANLTATGSITLTSTELNSLIASAGGAVALTEKNAITLTSVTTGNGTIGITAGGSITATSVKSLTDSGSNGITLVATTGDITVGNVLAGPLSNDVILTAGGDIRSQEVSLLQGDNATLVSGGSITLRNTELNSLAASSVGGTTFSELDDIELRDITSSAGGVFGTAGGGIAVAGKVQTSARGQTISLFAKDGDIAIAGELAGRDNTFLDLTAAYRIYDTGYSAALPAHITGGGVLHANAERDVTLWVDISTLEKSTARSFDIHAVGQNRLLVSEVAATRGDALFTVFDVAAMAAGTKPVSLGHIVLENIRVNSGSLVTSAGNTSLNDVIVAGGDIEVDAMRDADGYIVFGDVRTDRNVKARANLQIYSTDGTSRIHGKNLMLDVLNLHANTLGNTLALEVRTDVETLSITGGAGEYRVAELDAITAKAISIASGSLWLKTGGDITAHDIDVAQQVLLQTSKGGSLKRGDETAYISTGTLLLDVAGDADILGRTALLSAKVGGSLTLNNRGSLEIRGVSAKNGVSISATGGLRATANGHSYAPWSYSNDSGLLASTGDIALTSTGDMYLDRVDAGDNKLTLRSGGEIAWEHGTSVHLTARELDIFAQDRIQIQEIDGVEWISAESAMGTIQIGSVTVRNDAVDFATLRAFGDILIDRVHGDANLGTVGVTYKGGFDLTATGDITADEISATTVALDSLTGKIAVSLEAETLRTHSALDTEIHAAGANGITLESIRTDAGDIQINALGSLTLGEIQAGDSLQNNISLVSQEGGIRDDGNDATRVRGDTLTLTAAGNIFAQTEIATLAATTASSKIHVDELNALAVRNATTTDAGQVGIAAGGNITIGTIYGGTVQLTSGGNISMADETAFIATNALYFTAAGSVTASTSAGAVAGIAGTGVSISQVLCRPFTGDESADLAASDIRSTTGDISIRNDHGSIRFDLLDAASGAISLTANGDVTGENLTASALSITATDNVRLESIAGITALEIAPVGGEIRISEMTAGGAGNITVGNLEAAGDIWLGGVAGGLLLGNIASTNAGEIFFDATNGITATGEVRTAGAFDASSAAGDLRFAAVDAASVHLAALAGDISVDSLQATILDARAGGSITVAEANANGALLTLGNLFANGDISVTTGGALTIGTVESGTAQLTSGGNIAMADENALIVANTIALTAADSINVSIGDNALETALVLTAAGDAKIRSAGDLRLDGVSLGDNETLNVETGTNLTVSADALTAGNIGDIRFVSRTGDIRLEGANGIRANGDISITAENGSLSGDAIATNGNISVLTLGDILATDFRTTGAGATVALESTGGAIEILAGGITANADAYITLRAKNDIVSRDLAGTAFTGGMVNMLSEDGSIAVKVDASTFTAQAAKNVLINSASGEPTTLQSIATGTGDISVFANGTLVIGGIQAGANGDKTVILDNAKGSIRDDGNDDTTIRAGHLVLSTTGDISLKTQVASIGGYAGSGGIRHSGDVNIENNGALDVDAIDAAAGTAWGAGSISLKADSLNIAGGTVRAAGDVALIATEGNVVVRNIEADGDITLQTRDDLSTDQVKTNSANGNISLTVTDGSILIGGEGIYAGGNGTVHLDANRGIEGADTAAITGVNDLDVISRTGNISLTLDAKTVTATAQENIALAALGDVALRSVESKNGDVEIRAEGSITKGSEDSLVSGGTVELASANGSVTARTRSAKLGARAKGNVDLVESNDANLTALVSTNGNISLETTGAINSANADSEAVIVANGSNAQVVLNAANGIGNNAALRTNVRNLRARNTAAGVLNIANQGALNVALAETQNGSVTIGATGDLSANTVLVGGDNTAANLQSLDGNLSTGTITVGGSNSTVNLQALAGSVDAGTITASQVTATAGNDLTTDTITASQVELTANRDLTAGTITASQVALASGANLNAGTIAASQVGLASGGDLTAGRITASQVELTSSHENGTVHVREINAQRRLAIAAANARIGKVATVSPASAAAGATSDALEVALYGANGAPMKTADLSFAVTPKLRFTQYSVEDARLETDGNEVAFDGAWTRHTDIRTAATHVIVDSVGKNLRGGDAQIYTKGGDFSLSIADKNVYSTGYFLNYRDQSSANAAYGDENSVLRLARKEAAILHHTLRTTTDYGTGYGSGYGSYGSGFGSAYGSYNSDSASNHSTESTSDRSSESASDHNSESDLLWPVEPARHLLWPSDLDATRDLHRDIWLNLHPSTDQSLKDALLQPLPTFSAL